VPQGHPDTAVDRLAGLLVRILAGVLTAGAAVLAAILLFAIVLTAGATARVAALPPSPQTDRPLIEEALRTWRPAGSGAGTQVETLPAAAPPGCAASIRATSTAVTVVATACTTTADAAHLLRQVSPQLSSDPGLQTSFSGLVIAVRTPGGVARHWIQGRTLVQVDTPCRTAGASCDRMNAGQAADLSGTLPGDLAWPFTDLTGTRDLLTLPLVLWLLAILPFRVAAWLAAPRRVPARALPPPYRRTRRAVQQVRVALLLRPVAAALWLVGAFGLLAVGIALGGADVPPGDWVWVVLWLACLPAATMLTRFIRRHTRMATRRLVPGESGTIRGALGAGLQDAARLLIVVVALEFVVVAVATMMSSVFTPASLAEHLNELSAYSPVLTVQQRMTAITLLAAMWSPWAVVVLALGPALLLALAVDRLGLRIAAVSLAETLAADPRPPLLLLRSFDEDRLRVRTLLFRWGVLPRLFRPLNRARFEEVLTACLSGPGPVIGINPPGRELAALGAAKATLPHDGWRGPVAALTARASALVLLATPDEVRDGYRWELRMIASRAASLPILLVLAPYRRRELLRRFGTFVRAAGDTALFRPLADVEPPPGTLVIAKPAHGEWRSFGAGTASDLSYAFVTEDALRYALGGDQAGPAVPAP